MASIILPVEAGTPDSANGPGFTTRVGSDTAPAKTFVTADFDASTDETLWFSFIMPADYSSGADVNLLWMANATTGSVVWGASIGAITAADADTPLEHAPASASTVTTGVNGTEARRLVTSSITISSTDSVAAGDLVFLRIYRDADNGSDDAAVDAELISVEFEYTAA